MEPTEELDIREEPMKTVKLTGPFIMIGRIPARYIKLRALKIQKVTMTRDMLKYM
jgi:hypothetical protein